MLCSTVGRIRAFLEPCHSTNPQEWIEAMGHLRFRDQQDHRISYKFPNVTDEQYERMQILAEAQGRQGWLSTWLILASMLSVKGYHTMDAVLFMMMNGIINRACEISAKALDVGESSEMAAKEDSSKIIDWIINQGYWKADRFENPDVCQEWVASLGRIINVHSGTLTSILLDLCPMDWSECIHPIPGADVWLLRAKIDEGISLLMKRIRAAWPETKFAIDHPICVLLEAGETLKPAVCVRARMPAQKSKFIVFPT